jgi:uncharacterized ferritin-like protein (DUF455 family)
MKNFINFFRSSDINLRLSVIHECYKEVTSMSDEYVLEQLQFWKKDQLPSNIIYPFKILEKKNEKNEKVISNIPQHIQILHSIAHIEYNAKTIYADTLIRFNDYFKDKSDLRLMFIRDLSRVIYEESCHFHLLNNRLQELNYYYKMLESPDHLWQNCSLTNDDFIGRIVLISLVQESRGLDAGPKLIQKLKSMGEIPGSKIMKHIVNEEINHVNIGVKWFKKLCQLEHYSSEEEVFHNICKKYLKFDLKPPFNKELRDKAQLPESWYLF